MCIRDRLQALCDEPQVKDGGILLLAPTGKARVRMEQQIREMTESVIGEVAHLGEGDLCELVFKQLPGRVFAGVFVGISDPHKREILIEAAEQLGSWADPSYAHIGSPLAVFQDAAQKIMTIAYAEAERCRREPDEHQARNRQGCCSRCRRDP